MKIFVLRQNPQQALVLKGGNWELTSLFAAFLFSLAAFAETNERDLSELSLDELLDTKIQTVTAAVKRTQSITEAPSAVAGLRFRGQLAQTKNIEWIERPSAESK